jgi:DNA-directed RNA polymerase subunit RPC12/RpoP
MDTCELCKKQFEIELNSDTEICPECQEKLDEYTTT